MSIFGVSQGDAATFQEKYQQLIAQLFSRLLKFKDKKEDAKVQHPANKEETINFEVSGEEEQNRAINIQILEEVTEQPDRDLPKKIAAPMSDLATKCAPLEPDFEVSNRNKPDKDSKDVLSSPTGNSASKSAAIYSQFNSESRYMQRVNAIAIALAQYAKNAGRKIQVDGMSAYRWLATPDGCVKIEAKNKPEPILVKTQNKLIHVDMNQSELAYFEKALGISNSSQTQKNKPTLHQPLNTPSQSIAPKPTLRKK